MELGSEEILAALEETALGIEWDGDVEILLVGGAAAMLTGQLRSERVTQDCDVMHFSPEQAQQALFDAANNVARSKGLPDGWLSAKVMQLNILPDGWVSRREFIRKYGQVSIYAAGRVDLLCMKFYANRAQDRADIDDMKPTSDEINFVRRYLNMLRVPSRGANLDQVVIAFALVDAIEELLGES